MKIKILIEDSKGDKSDDSSPLINEFGLSMYIESNDKKILLDTGTTGAFSQNAKTLGIDIKDMDACVISHAHFDHGGGLDRFFKQNLSAPVYMHELATKEYYANLGAKMPKGLNQIVLNITGGSERFSRYIGLDQDVLSQNQDRISFVSKTIEIEPDIFLISPIQINHPKPEGNKFLLTKGSQGLEPDPFNHEIILAIREEDGIVLFSGCCHNGILNLIETADGCFKGEKIKAVVGGFHLRRHPFKTYFSGTRKDIEIIANALLKQGVDHIYTGHCTGQEAYDVLKEGLGDRLKPLYTGAQFSV